MRAENLNRFVLCHPDMLSFATDFVTIGTIIPIDREFFADGMPNYKIHLNPILEHPHRTDVVYFSSYNDMAEKKMEESIIFVLSDVRNVKSLTIVDLFDPLATMERVDALDEGRIATSNVDAHWWKTLPRRVNRILFDHHTLQNRFYYTGGNTLVHWYSAMKLIGSFGAVAFPDAGAAKRFGAYFPDVEHIVCAKQRDGDKRRVIIQDGDCTDRNVLIVDDLVRTGGTLIQCLHALKNAGAASISIFVTHAAFTGETWRKFTTLSDLKAFYITDTIPRMTDTLMNEPKFKVVSVKPIVKRALEQIES